MGEHSHVKCSLGVAITLQLKRAQKLIFLKASEEKEKKALPPGLLGTGWLGEAILSLNHRFPPLPRTPSPLQGRTHPAQDPKMPHGEVRWSGRQPAGRLRPVSLCSPCKGSGEAGKRPSLHKAGPGRSPLGSASTLLFGFQQIL